MKKILLMIGIIGVMLCASADQWVDPDTGITWTYILNGSTALVGGGEWTSPAVVRTTSGAIDIPSRVNGYPVTSIGSFAFENCREVTSVTIPSSVTNIGWHAFRNCDGLTSVTIPDSVINIGSGAFSDCRTLTAATIPEGVTNIGDEAFSGCRRMMSVTIPSSVTCIGQRVFSRCGCLMSIEVDEHNSNYKSENGLLLSKDGTRLIQGVNGEVTIPSGVMIIESDAFSWCSGLTRVTIPSSVTYIGGGFYGCSGLMSIEVDAKNQNYKSVNGLLLKNPDTTCVGTCVVTIEGASDSGMTLIAGVNGSVVIPSGVTTIARLSFYARTALTSVTIPASVTSIESDAFSCCSGLKSIEVDAQNKKYKSMNGLLLSKDGNMLIQGVNGDVTIPSSVRSIQECAFNGLSGLTSVTIPVGVVSVGENAFDDCDGLTSVMIPSSVMSIGENAFVDCDRLTSVTISEGVTAIGDEAFRDCDKLSSLKIPSSVTRIGWMAFADCPALGNGVMIVDNCVLTINGNCPENVILPNTTRLIAGGVFSGCCELKMINMPSSVMSIGLGAFEGCTGLGTGVVIVDGCVLTVNGTCPASVVLPKGTRLIGGSAFEDCGGLISVTIPEGVTSIGDYAFDDCDGLTSMTIPSSVTSIGRGAFACCDGLKNVNIPSGVTKIDDYTFQSCSALESVSIPSSVTRIGNYAFEDCHSLVSVTIPFGVTSIGKCAFYNSSIGVNLCSLCSQYKTLTIPSSVTRIGDEAFCGCEDLASVTILSSVTSIGHGAFDGCENLKTIYVEKNDADRVGCLLHQSGFDWLSVNFEISGPSRDFTGEAKRIFNGVVRTEDGDMCGMVQITTAKVMKKGEVKVSGFVMLEDGKKQTLKAVSGKIENGWLSVTTACGKLGDLSLTIGGDGFTGSLGTMKVESETLDENSGLLKGSLTLSYFDAKTGKIKTKKITLTGITDGTDVEGSFAIKGLNGIRFVAEINER